MAGNKLLLLNSLKLIFLIILNFGNIPKIEGTCRSLTSTSSTSVSCQHKGTPLRNCENPIDETTVSVSCLYEEYNLEDYINSVCRNGQWSPSIKQCYPINGEAHTEAFGQSNLPSPQTRPNNICSSLTSSTSTNFKCKHDGKPLKNCQNPINQTTVLISCNPSYEESSLQINPIRLCLNGKWSSTIPECKPSRYELPSTTSERSYPLLGGQTTIYHRVCPSLTSTTTINIYCILKDKLLKNCENATNGTIAFFSCNSFYKQPSLLNNPTRICKDGQWSSSIPDCYPIYSEVQSKVFENSNLSLGIKSRYNSVCPSLISSTSTNFTCKHDDKPLKNCENAINGTTVVISCNTFYEKSNNQNNPISTCRDGKWSSSIPQCKPICGKPLAKNFGTPNRLFGNKSSLHDYPWHVGIYSYAKEYLCGGTIINPNIILTAAHCVTDVNGNLNPLNNYLVTAGKYYSYFNDIRDRYAQYSQVSKIYIPRGYNVQRSYTFDIAVLILNQPFALSIAVQPVCIDLYEETANLDNLLNNPGIVTGWGSLNIGEPFSEALKQLIIQYIPFRQCYQEAHESQRSSITSDKICGISLRDGPNLCHGDGGGGLIFKNVVDDRYYIRGIASVGLFFSGDCYLSQYAVYTLVSRHIEFVKSLIQPYI